MRNLLLFLSFAGIILACGEDPKSEINTDLLTGKWELKKATKNGSPTVMLGDLYFDFDGAGQMETNMPTMDGASDYALNGTIIEQRNEQVENDYQIESLNDTALILSTQIQAIDFLLILGKSTE
ncbi:MAG: hypothetical protein AAF847_01870 [Bacteroidota bacterium]